MDSRRIDLNCDLGEDPAAVRDGRDAAIMEWATSVNIACGGHAGDEVTMAAVVRAALARGTGVGAHPSYPDRDGFGRVEMVMTPADLEVAVAGQIRTLARIVTAHHAELAHVKPHGALYHACRKPEVARAVARGVAKWSHTPVLVGQAGSPALDVWASMGFAVAGEAFADRAYEPDGSLRARGLPGAVLDHPDDAAAQAESIALGRGVRLADGRTITLRADTLCVHSDTPDALGVARAVRRRLEASGVTVRRLGAPAGTKHPGHDSNVRPAL